MCTRAATRSTCMPERRDERAAALRYTGEGAPQVVASGRGAVADTILARAREAGVPVHQDPALADALASLALGAEVPEELWKAVAEVLAWAYALEKGGDYPKGVM
jgi:flagellar biosynthesis protein